MANLADLQKKWAEEAWAKTNKGKIILENIFKDDKLIELANLFEGIIKLLTTLQDQPLPLHVHDQTKDQIKRLEKFLKEKA